jgi:uncharacterized protein YbjT (DUF2867 family)
MSPSTVLVTGASCFIGGQLAARLAGDPRVARVFAVDAVPPVGRVLGHHPVTHRVWLSPRWTTVQAFDGFIRGRALRPTIDPNGWRRGSGACSGSQAGCGSRRWWECRTRG